MSSFDDLRKNRELIERKKKSRHELLDATFQANDKKIMKLLTQLAEYLKETMTANHHHFENINIVSWGHPDIYADVYSYHWWIVEQKLLSNGMGGPVSTVFVDIRLIEDENLGGFFHLVAGLPGFNEKDDEITRRHFRALNITPNTKGKIVFIYKLEDSESLLKSFPDPTLGRIEKALTELFS